jgi:hypothetical protein
MGTALQEQYTCFDLIKDLIKDAYTTIDKCGNFNLKELRGIIKIYLNAINKTHVDSINTILDNGQVIHFLYIHMSKVCPRSLILDDETINKAKSFYLRNLLDPITIDINIEIIKEVETTNNKNGVVFGDYLTEFLYWEFFTVLKDEIKKLLTSNKK